ncbi:Suf-domain-containing protein [Coniophora puteana RWD-64-598 SS2]|uniref:mRNA 3'-end-processing protein RNA14 n=1 Tax=Coniophora puteana (strain RWD-64-598) TaxID=741705 RepID=A0A5M3MRF8_CONPW|nr:Suf-domain-containing protein [Coniophora puteana RWD-64-598 SS2]EIW81739.1 Suf-domain-containing protein [Coniophora puteana RWD-64-598 SS2]
MSEQQQADPNNPQTNDLEQTQPTEDILSALNALTNSRAPTEQASAPSEWQQLREKLREHPLDPDGWARLVDLAESAGELEQIKATYEALLETYPNTASAQIAYINHYLSPGLFSYAEELFKRFLRTSPIVELWKFYLTYVRRINTTPNSRENIRLAYEFALNRIGHDKDSGEIWNDYVQFIKSGNTTNTWEEQQKMDALRKVYHRAVQIPLENVEKLWSELETFESGLNKITAKKFMSDLSPAHMQARTVLRQLQRHLGPLFPPGPTSSSSAGGGKVAQNLPAAPTFTAGERALVGSWKAYLKWEESNPLEIEDKERATFIGRVQQVYKKAVIRMRFFSEVWYMSFVWTNSIGKHEEAVNILKAGIESNPRSFLLNFAYAEVLENREQYTEVAAIYDKLLELLRIELESLEARASSSTNTSLSSSQEYAPPTNGYNMNGSMASIGTQPADESGGKDKEKDKDKGKSKELAERRSEFGLVWTMYIRFARRAHDLKTFRSIFQRARRDRWTPWEVYEAAALMEYHCTKEGGAGVASRIFEKGLESFGDEVEFVLRYLGFLISVNDDNNARALFERVITTFTPDKARPLWERWARYEYQFGDLKAAQALEKRIAEVYPNGQSPISSPLIPDTRYTELTLRRRPTDQTLRPASHLPRHRRHRSARSRLRDGRLARHSEPTRQPRPNGHRALSAVDRPESVQPVARQRAH